MNYMEQVAKMLGVELGEEFYLLGFSYKHKITKNGTFFYHKENHKWYRTRSDLSDILTGKYKIIKNPILDDQEYKDLILCDGEREYLSAVIKPFRDRVISVRKYNYDKYYEYITIIYYDVSKYLSIYFPPFKKGTMYKGMELDRNYTLEELGLWKILINTSVRFLSL